MKTLMYLTDDINALDLSEHELENKGVPRESIRILSNNEIEVQVHDLPALSDWSKRDITHNGLIGAGVGLIGAIFIFIGASIIGVNEAETWLLLSFVALLVIGFATWEGGLIGIQKMNHHFVAFKTALEKGAHLMIIDVSKIDEHDIRETISKHPTLRAVI